MVIFLLFMIVVLLFYVLKALHPRKRDKTTAITDREGLLVAQGIFAAAALLSFAEAFGGASLSTIFLTLGAGVTLFIYMAVRKPKFQPDGAPASTERGKIPDTRFEHGKECINCGERLMNAALKCPRCGASCSQPNATGDNRSKAGDGDQHSNEVHALPYQWSSLWFLALICAGVIAVYLLTVPGSSRSHGGPTVGEEIDHEKSIQDQQKACGELYADDDPDKAKCEALVGHVP